MEDNESRPQPHSPLPIKEQFLTTYAEGTAKAKDEGQKLQRAKATKRRKREMAAASSSIANKETLFLSSEI